MQEKTKWIQLAVAWEKDQPDGSKMISVKLNHPLDLNTTIFLKKNKFKKNDKAPDYIFVVPEEWYVNGEVVVKGRDEKEKPY